MKEEIEKLVKWIRRFVRENGRDGVTLGLSGGVDSAVVAALAVRAFGVDDVNVLALPIESDPKDLEDARRVAEFLGLNLKVYDLESVCLEMATTIGMVDLKTRLMSQKESLCLGNMKARLRMIAVYNEAAMCNHLVVGTGNKSELMLGYITKWGDGACDFEPLGEYFKTEVVEMALALGLPEDICTREPSPGLEPGVTDRTELGGGYDEIDPVLMAISAGRNYYYDSENGRFDKETFHRLEMMMEKASHKKRMPPSYPRYGR